MGRTHPGDDVTLRFGPDTTPTDISGTAGWPVDTGEETAMNIYRRTALTVAAAAAAVAFATAGTGLATATGTGAPPRSTPMCPAGVYPGCSDQASCIGVTHDNRCHHNSHHGDRMRAVRPGGQMLGI